ncbi:MAG: hypothetical protein ABIM98_03080 [candidate division WOR-3 bacterium]
MKNFFKKFLFSKIRKELYEREKVFLMIIFSPLLGLSPFLPFSFFLEIYPYLEEEIKNKKFFFDDDPFSEVLGFFDIS